MRPNNRIKQQRSPESANGILNFFGIFSGESNKKQESSHKNYLESRKMSSSNKIEQKNQYYSNVNSNYDTNQHEKSRQNPIGGLKPMIKTQFIPPNMYGNSTKPLKEITSMQVMNPLKGYSPVKNSRPSTYF